MQAGRTAMENSRARGPDYVRPARIRQHFPLFIIDWSHVFGDEVGCMMNTDALVTQAMCAIP